MRRDDNISKLYDIACICQEIIILLGYEVTYGNNEPNEMVHIRPGGDAASCSGLYEMNSEGQMNNHRGDHPASGQCRQ